LKAFGWAWAFAEIIRFFRYPRSIIYNVASKYLASKISKKDFANLMRKSHLKEKLVKTPVIIEKVQELISENPKAVSDEISKNLG